MLNMHAKSVNVKPKRGKPTSDVWESMGLDAHLSPRIVEMRKETGRMMEESWRDIIPHVEAATFPFWMIPKLQKIGMCGFCVNGYGSPSMTHTEAGSIICEVAKKDVAICAYLMIHNFIGIEVIDKLGS